MIWQTNPRTIGAILILIILLIITIIPIIFGIVLILIIVIIIKTQKKKVRKGSQKITDKEIYELSSHIVSSDRIDALLKRDYKVVFESDIVDGIFINNYITTATRMNANNKYDKFIDDLKKILVERDKKIKKYLKKHIELKIDDKDMEKILGNKSFNQIRKIINDPKIKDKISMLRKYE